VTMMLASEIEGRPLIGAGGEPLGTVEKLLFHPSEPRVIGASVRPPAAMIVVTRPETFLPLSALTFQVDGHKADLAKLPTQRAAAKPLGFDPDLTVIWTDMPVASPTGRQIGTVADVEFDTGTGVLSRMEVAAGAIADAAHGRFVVPADLVVGYSAGAVRVTAEAGTLEATGGLAKTAARTVVVVSARAAVLVAAVEDTVVAASGAAGRAIKAVADAKVTKAATRRVKGTWSDTLKAFREGMKDDKK
jgi:uncharacterized protein YrrD